MRFILRQLFKSPVFSAVAILSLALGIGANTAIFSLVNEVALKLLPVRNPEELVLFHWLSGSPGMMRSTWGWGGQDPKTKLRTSTSFSKLTYERFRENSRTLKDTFAFAPLSGVTVLADGQAEVVPQAQVVSGNYFSALGVSPERGRPINGDDDHVGAEPVAVISHSYWERRFNSDPAAIGKTFTMNRVAFIVVGITPAGFNGTLQVGETPDISVPLVYAERLLGDNEISQPWSWWLRVMGRLRPGATLEQAAAELEPIFQQSARDGYEAYPRQRLAANAKPPVVPLLRVTPGGQGLTEQRLRMAQTLKLLAGLVALVLAIACTNVANLLLARGTARQKEISIRLALGASRWRVIRQLLAESTLLSGIGGALGIVFAVWGANLLLALNPFGRNMVLSLSLDWRVLTFTGAVSMGTGILFGLAPALRATRLNLNSGLMGSGKGVDIGVRSWLPKALMVVQVSLSLILLVGAGLFFRTLQSLQAIDVGFNRSQLLLFHLEAEPAGYDKTRFAELDERIADRLRNLPGVQAVAFSHMPLLSQSSNSTDAAVPGRTPPRGNNVDVYQNRVDPDFFRTFEIPLVLGRLFTLRDDGATPKVAIINQTMARLYFGDENPIGREYRTGGSSSPSPPIEVIGIVRDAHYSDLRSEIPPTAYYPFRQQPTSAANFAIRAVGDPNALLAAVRKVATEIDPNLPFTNLRTQDEQVNRILAPEILFTRLSSFFGLIALALACIGLYGLMSYSVLRRTTEIGIRMALGALPADVRWMVLRESLGLVLLGLLIGIGGAIVAMRAVNNLLYGLSPHDPAVYLAMSAVLLGVALLACWLPARRATQVDPMTALRAE